MKKRTRVITLLAVAGMVLLGRGYVQRAVTAWTVFHDVAPSEDSVAQVLERSSDPVGVVRRLWSSRKVAARTAVLAYLRRHAIAGSVLWPATRDIVMEASRCGDVEVEQSALAILERNNDPEAPSVAAGMLQDRDPEVRQVSLLYIRRMGGKEFIPLLVKLLDDPDGKVIDLAANGLRDLTKQEIEIQYDSETPTTRPEFQMAIGKWKQWWAEHHGEYDKINVPAPATAWALGPGIPAQDFKLIDLEGKPVKLSSLAGKTVLINFFATWCPPCVREIPDLVELHHRRPDLVILGVAVDANPHDDDDEPKGSEGPEQRIRRLARDKQINYPVLIDRDSHAMAPYGGGDLPVSILVDPQGMVRRRMIGARSVEVWETLVDDLSKPVVASR